MNVSAEKTIWRTVGSIDSIPLREGRCVKYSGREIALFNLGGEFLAVENRCPHRSGPLADGIVSGKSVFCPLHNWKVDLVSGCVSSGGEGAVRTFPVRVVDGKVQVSFSS